MRLLCTLLLSAPFFAAPGCVRFAPESFPAGPAQEDPSAGSTLRWLDAAELHLEGKGWHEPARPFTRLPARAEGEVSDLVWRLSHNTAGLAVRFHTDAPEIHARWSGGGAMNHMAASGVSGLDLYRRNANGEWTFAGVGRPDPETTEQLLASNASGEEREYLLFLPLYQNVTLLEIGIAPDASFSQPAPEGKPIVFYGTSIVQGGCASRTGMAHAAILRRWLDREVINLGFSGAARMEPVMAELLGELDAAVYVLDCLPNMTDELVEENLERFVRRLRELRPGVPVILVEHLKPELATSRNAALHDLYTRLVEEGEPALHYVEGSELLRGREEGTVDGIHPTDLGFLRMAEAMERPLREALTAQ